MFEYVTLAVTWIAANWPAVVWGVAGVLLPILTAGARRLVTRQPGELAAKLIRKMVATGDWILTHDRVARHHFDCVQLCFDGNGSLFQCEVAAGATKDRPQFNAESIIDVFPKLSRRDKRAVGKAAKQLRTVLLSRYRDVAINNAIDYLDSTN